MKKFIISKYGEISEEMVKLSKPSQQRRKTKKRFTNEEVGQPLIKEKSFEERFKEFLNHSTYMKEIDQHPNKQKLLEERFVEFLNHNEFHH